MNKGLKALNELYETMPLVFEESKTKMRCLETIEKELKALEIIRNKKVDAAELVVSADLKTYNYLFRLVERWQLTQEEYDLLKEVLL